jgi:asparagine synthetase B (glutamine-hydrolysing)
MYLDMRVVLGHRRLSIIDLSDAGQQPMANEDGTIWVTYNSEIYNFC